MIPLTCTTFDKHAPVCVVQVTMFPHARSRLNETGEASFKAQLYWSMIAQALAMKQNIESTRGFNRFGTLVWQLNEIVSP